MEASFGVFLATVNSFFFCSSWYSIRFLANGPTMELGGYCFFGGGD